jgi:hypothetical protein
MVKNHHIWRVWSGFLHRWGLNELTAALLEALGPLTILGAQAVYLGQPVLSTLVPTQHLEAMASLLEEPEETGRFVDFLREDGGTWT